MPQAEKREVIRISNGRRPVTGKSFQRSAIKKWKAKVQRRSRKGIKLQRGLEKKENKVAEWPKKRQKSVNEIKQREGRIDKNDQFSKGRAGS